MSSTPEKLRGSKPDLGRDYYIDAIDALEGAMVIEESNMDKYRNDKRVQAFINYIGGNFKRTTTPSILFKDISFDPPVFGLNNRSELGVIYAQKSKAPLDLLDSGGSIFIPRQSPTLQIGILKVIFPQDNPKETVTPEMTSKSLDTLAGYLRFTQPQDSLPDMMYGLTHPRIGKLSKRWGFDVIEMPFTPEVYEFIEQADSKLKDFPDDLEALKKIGQQVMVYQPTAKFIELHCI